ncbi:MAG: ribosome biogenesis GTPase Der [Spirochaetaceae bacterium]|jgi:GTP-binding protein|nr:ribosome biogenesis GTPase Der [Spirochaetaceae bacterium]
MDFIQGVKYSRIPTVVLAGRPNVGKSTLFNRLLRKRRSITSPIPGVTRDPVSQDVFICGKPLSLVDTGGFKLDRSESDKDASMLDDLVVERTLQRIENADLIVLLLAAGDITAEDEEFIKMLRPLQNKVIIAVNKTEGGRLAAEAWNLLSYGFPKIYMISAEHGDNIADLENAIVSSLDFSKVREAGNNSQDSLFLREPIKIAISGKPNTGKSSLANRLTSTENSIISDIPGTTRDIIEGKFSYKGRDFFVLDTAGIRRKSRVNEDIEYYSVNRAIKSFDTADVIILMIDAEEGLSEQDKKIAGLACDKGRPVIFALNKWDLMPKLKNTFESSCENIRYFFGQMEYAPVVALSAKDGDGVKELLNTVVKLHTQLNKKTETSDFNRALEKWQVEYPPPSGPSTRFKIKYGVQTTSNPVHFKLFVSRPKAVTGAYSSYICNKIRKDLGYTMIPISLEILPCRRDRRN